MTDRTKALDDYLAQHYIHRSNWLRAAVLGANDGILSVASLAIGVATASDTREPIILVVVAGLVAGALSMAAGEYVSVSSQTDVERADIEREEQELVDMACSSRKNSRKKMHWRRMSGTNSASTRSVRPSPYKRHLLPERPSHWVVFSPYWQRSFRHFSTSNTSSMVRPSCSSSSWGHWPQ